MSVSTMGKRSNVNLRDLQLRSKGKLTSCPCLGRRQTWSRCSCPFFRQSRCCTCWCCHCSSQFQVKHVARCCQIYHKVLCCCEEVGPMRKWYLCLIRQTRVSSNAGRVLNVLWIHVNWCYRIGRIVNILV